MEVKRWVKEWIAMYDTTRVDITTIINNYGYSIASTILHYVTTGSALWD